MLEQVNAAPTAYQLEAFSEIAPRFAGRLNEVNEFLRGQVPGWNESLRKSGVPALVVGKVVDPPRK
jgi:hypothetical protein